jgi:extracellular factor (EF) 3-hydroxypalmitic acid methyl ester biosynthesis protein
MVSPLSAKPVGVLGAILKRKAFYMGTENGNGTATRETQTRVSGTTSTGVEFHAEILRLTRYAVTFETFGPEVVLRVSEAVEELRITGPNRTLYFGRAVVKSIADGGGVFVCEVTLDETSWIDLTFDPSEFEQRKLRAEFRNFIGYWQKFYKIAPEFKVVVADLESFLHELKLWLDQIELNLRSQSSGDRAEMERSVLQDICREILPNLGMLFERFENATPSIEPELQAAHAAYSKRVIHPSVLCAPFMYRTYRKPLGYAGDYEMVNMMTRDTFEGASVYAKVMNTFFLNTPPVVAHQNRITQLTQMLIQETERVSRSGRRIKILNLGCGPAMEIQKFLSTSPLASQADFTLLDFNDETVAYTKGLLEDLVQQFSRRTSIRVLKKSVAQLLKEQAKPVPPFRFGEYDLVYCAGLFDYLADPICAKLVEVFYQMLAPRGLVTVTNVDVSNPAQGWMEYMVDWHLVYRNSNDMLGIMPPTAPEDAINVFAEPSGVNIFAEVRKPANA